MAEPGDSFDLLSAAVGRTQGQEVEQERAQAFLQAGSSVQPQPRKAWRSCACVLGGYYFCLFFILGFCDIAGRAI